MHGPDCLEIALATGPMQFPMCFYNGINISRAEHIRLKELEITIRDYDVSLNRAMMSGFDFADWPVIKPIDGGNGIVLEMMHWEFIPSFFKTWEDVAHFRKGGYNPKTGKTDPPKNMLNAIGEEMLDKPSFKHAALKRRCLVLSSGFYEWRHFIPPGSKKDIAYPYHITVKGKEFFFMAGIWQPWTDQESGETIDTFAIVTTKANALMAQVHNKRKRMPLILPEALAREWIKDGLTADRILEIVNTEFPPGQMEACTIEKDFRRSDDPTRPFQYEELPELQPS